jgi:phosphatidate cytidylyltransferase
MILKRLTAFQQRLVVGGLTTIFALSIILLSQVPAFKPFFSALIAETIGMALWEFYNIARAKGLKPAQTLGISFGIAYALMVALGTQYHWAAILPEFTLWSALFCCFLYFFIKGTSPLQHISITIFGLIYLAVPLSCMISIVYFFGNNGIQDGRWWLFYLVAVTKMTDTGGFFIGKKFGRQKLAPYISPGKTWEGALGGLACAIGSSLLITLFAWIFGSQTFLLSIWDSLWLGAALGLAAQCGDLSESLLKRDGGIKDSNQLPGLGGMLDIVDSLVFTSPLMYLFLKTFG